jgi:hypothetical protein
MEACPDGKFRYGWRWTSPFPKYQWYSSEFASKSDAEAAMRKFIDEHSEPLVHVTVEPAA